MSNQISDILQLADQAIATDTEAVLATVVHIEGSAYRKPGAMMLICADGQSVGMISGGCLEPHIIKKALWLTRNGPVVQVYQTGEDLPEEGAAKTQAVDDIEFSIQTELNFGLGCNGRVHVLFERLDTAKAYLKMIKQVRQTQQPVTMATLIRSQEANHPVGLHVQLASDPNLVQVASVNNISADCDELINQAIQSLSAKYVSAKHTAKHIGSGLTQKPTDFATITSMAQQDITQPLQTQWLVQQLQPQKRLLICGAGNDVQPLVRLAKMQDWHVTVIDSRSHYATRSRFMEADQVQCVPLEDTQTLLALSQNAAVAVMSHSLTQDRARLQVLLANPPLYLGQLGPKYRTERLIDEIKQAYQGDVNGLEQGISQLYYPIGYKLGGDGPEALALGVMAQISAVMHGKENTLSASINAKEMKQASQPKTASDRRYKDRWAAQ
ncbi:XdhC family protein [Psychrobacter raelei]|uniref:XdhC family protein n=1 Tax=Psychrobacter raelei TaxID=2565531 RepID=A0AAT9PFU8_9GAMM|nr:XdhC/CoxI family protein [Psychrobacter sp. PraFG1]UNK06267.1 XdhC family protein [Psychrobacter sp. PraFG1]